MREKKGPPMNVTRIVCALLLSSMSLAALAQNSEEPEEIVKDSISIAESLDLMIDADSLSADISEEMAEVIDSIEVDSTLIANYQLQFLIDAASAHGTLSGGGWTDESDTAFVSVAPESIFVGDSILYDFAGWAGDFSGGAHRIPALVERFPPDKRIVLPEKLTVCGAEFDRFFSSSAIS